MEQFPELEREALERSARGESVKEIADAMGASVTSVKRWLALAYARLGAVNGRDAIRIAMAKGWISG